MSKVDDELTRRFHRAERPLASEELFEGMSRRRRRHERVRRLEVGSLAIVVLIATAAGFVSLRSMFERGDQSAAASAFGAEGAVVGCTDETGTHLCRLGAESLARGGGAADLVRLTDLADEIVSMPSVSFDGTTVVFDRFDPADSSTSLWTIGVDGTGLRRLTSDDSPLTNASWGPDGSLVAVASAGTAGDGPAALAILDPADAPEPVVRTIELHGLSFPSTPRFSPDGRLILFTAGEDPNSTDTHVYTVGADGSQLTRRTDSVAWTPDWSPDGSRIVFGVATGNGEGLFVCPLDCSAPRRLEDPSARPITGGLPRWSPDGGWISFQTADEDGDSTIDVVRVNGSDARTMASPAGEMAWIASRPEQVTTEGRDIGLGVAMCDLQVLEGIDWDGSGIDGAAWTGAPVDEDGRCSSAPGVQHIVAVDRDGDGAAEQGSTSTLRSCVLCRPFDTVDLNEDGVLELVVLEEASSTPTYSLYEVNRPGSERAPGVYPIVVVPPGAPAMNLDENQPARFTVGGDEGFSGSIVCEGTEGPPVLRYTWVRGAVDADTDLNVKVARLSFGDDDVFHVKSVDSFRVPRDPEPTELTSTQPACGVDWSQRAG